MKAVALAMVLLVTTPVLSQDRSGKTGFIDYGNASLLYAAKGAPHEELWSIRPSFKEMAFSADEETVYIKNPENFIYSRNPEKKIMYGWSLISQKKEMYDVSQLPATRKGREILSRFTPHYSLTAFAGGRKGVTGGSCWITADLQVTVNDHYSIVISDTNHKQVAAFTLPDYFANIKPEVFKNLKTKPKDYEVNFTFCFYPKSNMLYISGDCGKYGKDYNRLWQYQFNTGTVTEIPFFTTHRWDNGDGFASFGKVSVSFVGDYIVRQYFTEYKQMNYEFIAQADGTLAGKCTMPTQAEEGQDNRVLAFLPQMNQIVFFNHNLEFDITKRRYYIKTYDTTLQHLTKSVILDAGKADISGTADEFPIRVSDQGKFFGFAALLIHPEIGCYLSVNYDLLEDADRGFMNSIADNSIHAPLITNNYTTADFERQNTALEEKSKAVKALQAELEQIRSSISNKNDQLTDWYNRNQLSQVLTKGNTWKTDRAEFKWSVPYPQGVLNSPTPYSFGVSYAVTFSLSSVSVNYVDMQCTEVAEAFKDYRQLNREERMYGESYFKPVSNSHTLTRNPNYKTGHSYLTFDKPELDDYRAYLEKATDLFTGNSFDITTQEQLGMQVVVLKYPLRSVAGKFIYLYPGDILEWLHQYNTTLSRLKTKMEEIQKVGE